MQDGVIGSYQSKRGFSQLVLDIIIIICPYQLVSLINIQEAKFHRE